MLLITLFLVYNNTVCVTADVISSICHIPDLDCRTEIEKALAAMQGTPQDH